MIVKAIVPAAGLGSRFLPATKAIPKEMLPVLDKPALQYGLEEGVSSGINNFVVVSGPGKSSIEKHLEHNLFLEQQLALKQENDALSSIEKIIQSSSFSYVPQSAPLGLGHALWSARHAIGREQMAVILPDDVFTYSTPPLMQLMKIAQQEKCNVVAVKEVSNDEISRYGVVGIKKQFSPNLFQVKELVEKPSLEQAPSNLAIVGRYILSPTIFDVLGETQSGAIGEIQLTDAIQQLIYNGEKVFAFKVQGTHYDCGTKLSWLQSNIALSLQHPEYAQKMAQYLSELDKDFLMIEGKAASLRKEL